MLRTYHFERLDGGGKAAKVLENEYSERTKKCEMEEAPTMVPQVTQERSLKTFLHACYSGAYKVKA